MFPFAYWLFFSAVVCIEVFRKKSSKIDFFSFFVFMFLISYLLPAALWITLPEKYSAGLPYDLKYNAAARPAVFLTLVVSYCSFMLSYFFFCYIKLPFRLSCRLSVCSNVVSKRLLVAMLPFSFLVVLGVLVQGGIYNYIAAGVEARHNHSGYGFIGYLTYFFSAYSLIFVGIALIFLFNEKARVSLGQYVLLVFLGVLGSIALLVTGGRGSIVYVVVYVMFFVYMSGKLRFGFMTIVGSVVALFLSLFVISELHGISYAVINGLEIDLVSKFIVFYDGFFESFLYVFKYYAHYLFIIVELYDSPEVYGVPRLGADNYTSMIMMVPGYSSETVGLPTLPDEISQGVMGKYNGMIPPGWIGWAMINGGVIWLVIKIVVAAFFGAVLDKSKNSMVGFCGYVGLYVYFSFIVILYTIFFTANASSLFRGNLGLYMFFVMVFFVPFIRIVKISILKCK